MSTVADRVADSELAHTTLGALSEYVTSGSRDWSKYYADSGAMFIRTQDINQNRLSLDNVAYVQLPAKIEGKRSLVRKGDLLITITGANVGKVAVVEVDLPEAYVSQSVCLVRLKDASLAKFIQLQLIGRRGDKTALEAMAYGLGRPVLNLENVRSAPVMIGPALIRTSIIAEVEMQFPRLDEGVATLKRVKANLKRYKVAVLQAAVQGRLVPNEAQLARPERRTYETGEQLLQRILETRRSQRRGKRKYPASAGALPPRSPKLPDGWTWATFEQITDNFDGVRVPVRSKDREGRQGPYAYYGASGVIDHVDDYLFDGEYLLVAEDGANLLSRSTPIAFRASGRFWVNNHAHVVQTHGGIPLAFLELYLNGFDLAQFITGSAQPKLTQAAINKIPVPLPSIAEQHRIVAEVDRRLSIVRESDAEVETNMNRARALRQVILGVLFNGSSRAE